MQIGRYEIRDSLAAGGAGQVYRAWDPQLRREVAIKLLQPPRSDRARERLSLELEALTRLSHPNFVSVHDVGEHEGRPFIVLALIEGESLQALLERAGPLDPDAALELIRVLALALESAHRERILHRDIKPSNVLMGQDGRPRLIDFGIALDLDRETRLSQTGTLVGTPGFAAPEQVATEVAPLSPSTDVYGLGATLYAALTGNAPAEGETLLEIMHRTLQQTPRSPTALRPGIPSALSAVCLRCLEKRPDDRYPTAQALAEALASGRAGSPARKARRLGLILGSSLLLAGAAIAAAIVVARQPTPAPLDVAPGEGPTPSQPAAVLQSGLWRLELGERLSYRVEWRETAELAGTEGQNASFSVRFDWEVVATGADGIELAGVCADCSGVLRIFAGNVWRFPAAEDSPFNVLTGIDGTPIRMRLDPKTGRVLEFEGLEQARARILGEVAPGSIAYNPIKAFSRALSRDFMARGLNLLGQVGPVPGESDATWLTPFPLATALATPPAQRTCRARPGGRVSFSGDVSPGTRALPFLLDQLQAALGEAPCTLRGSCRYQQGRLVEATAEQVSLGIPNGTARVDWSLQLESD